MRSAVARKKVRKFQLSVLIPIFATEFSFQNPRKFHASVHHHPAVDPAATPDGLRTSVRELQE